MSLFSIVKQDILKNKEIKTSGRFIGVPMPFKRLSEYIPLCAERGQSIGILGATGSGKSRFTRWLWVYSVYMFYKATGYAVKVIYFPLEDSKEKVMRNMICHYLHEIYGIYINLQELDSKGTRILSDDMEAKLNEAEEFFKEFETVVTIVDGYNEPTKIYEFCKEYAMRTGHTETYKINMDGKMVEQYRYIAHGDVHTIVIIDNMSNIDIEEGQPDERRSVVHLCRNLVRGRLCNFFNFTVVQVLQQDFASERQSFNRDGDSVIAKLEPSLAGIGDSKTISRSMHIVYGLFHPARFGIIHYPKPTKSHPETYRLDILGNRFRSLHILKANDTDFGMRIPFNFDAVSENMTELPELGSEQLTEMYRRIQEKHPDKFSKLKRIELPKAYVEEEDEELEEPPF